jgi:hypothetical protein
MLIGAAGQVNQWLSVMGMSAEIMAIGPFSADIADALEYPVETYARTRPGVTVFAYLFSVMPGSSTSRAFAEHLGIDDAWDFNQHKIDAGRVDLDALRAFIGPLLGPDSLADIERFVRLRDKGFEFFFRPNG